MHFLVLDATDMNQLVQGGQLYLSFPFSKDSLNRTWTNFCWQDETSVEFLTTQVGNPNQRERISTIDLLSAAFYTEYILFFFTKSILKGGQQYWAFPFRKRSLLEVTALPCSLPIRPLIRVENLYQTTFRFPPVGYHVPENFQKFYWFQWNSALEKM
jgi:hypothetical protein